MFFELNDNRFFRNKWLEIENVDSLGTLVALIAKYFFARLASCGIDSPCKRQNDVWLWPFFGTVDNFANSWSIVNDVEDDALVSITTPHLLKKFLIIDAWSLRSNDMASVETFDWSLCMLLLFIKFAVVSFNCRIFSWSSIYGKECLRKHIEYENFLV